MGTPAYIPPEVLAGGDADARSDIWSLGVILFEMASGEQPFTGKTAAALASAIMKDPPVALPARIPLSVRGIIQRCLAKEPSQRYQSAGEVRAALEAANILPGESRRARSRIIGVADRPVEHWTPARDLSDLGHAVQKGEETPAANCA